MMIFRNARALILIFLAALPSPALAQSNTTRTKINAPDPEQDESNALLATAQDAMSKKDYSAAVDAYHSYLTMRPDDAIAHFQLGYAFTALSRPADARPEYERAIELNPNMAEAYENLGDLDRRLRYRLFEAGGNESVDALIEDIVCRSPRRRFSLEALLATIKKP